MKDGKWELTILSDLKYENLVAEMSFDKQFLLLLDREQGPDQMCIAFPDKGGQLGERIPLTQFIEKLQALAEDLRR